MLQRVRHFIIGRTSGASCGLLTIILIGCTSGAPRPTYHHTHRMHIRCTQAYSPSSSQGAHPVHPGLLTIILIGCTSGATPAYSPSLLGRTSGATRASAVHIGGTLATIMLIGRTRVAPQATRHHTSHCARIRLDSGESGVSTITITHKSCIRPDSGESGVTRSQ